MLSEEGLVPAALIYLTFKNTAATSSAAATAPANAESGWYIRPELINTGFSQSDDAAQSKQSGPASVAATAFPSGVPVVPRASSSANQSSAQQGYAESKSGSGDRKTSSSGGSKPKWFKL